MSNRGQEGDPQPSHDDKVTAAAIKVVDAARDQDPLQTAQIVWDYFSQKFGHNAELDLAFDEWDAAMNEAQ